MKKISKTEAKKEIEEFFQNIKSKNSKEIKKIKRLAMRHNLHLKEKKRLFCKKCLEPYSGKENIRIKNGKKVIECMNCGHKKRIKIN